MVSLKWLYRFCRDFHWQIDVNGGTCAKATFILENIQIFYYIKLFTLASIYINKITPFLRRGSPRLHYTTWNSRVFNENNKKLYIICQLINRE